MNDAPHPALLPAGLYDLLPPDARDTARALAYYDYFLVRGAGPPAAELEPLASAGSWVVYRRKR